MKKLKLILLCGLVVTTTIINAQENENPRPPKKPVKQEKGAKLTPEQRAEKQTARMTNQLALQENQKKPVYDVMLERIKKAEADKASCKGDGKCMKQMRVQRNKLADTKLKTILNAEQYNKLQEIRKQAKEKKAKKPATPPVPETPPTPPQEPSSDEDDE